MNLKSNALKYFRYKDVLNSIPKEEIDEFRQKTSENYYLIHIPVIFVDKDPYENCEDLIDQVNETGELLVSSLFNNSKLLPDILNLQFRAFHDWLHYITKAPFTYEGEKEVYKIQSRYYSIDVGKKILKSEIVLQAAYKEYFGIFAEEQKVIIQL